MKLASAMLTAIMTAIAATTGLGSAAAAAKKVHLFQNNFDPDASAVLGDFTAATFDGYGAQDLAEDVGVTGTDPLSGEKLVRIVTEAGGDYWVVSGTTNLPQTIYGHYVTDSAGTGLKAFERWATPVEITASGQIIDMPDIGVKFSADAFA